MVALFASLKWRLLTSRLRHQSRGRRLAAIAGLVLAAVVVALVSTAIAALHWSPSYGLIAGSLILTGQAVAWMLSPLIAFGVDETVDPHRFALLPVPRPVLMRGLTVSALIGWLPVANVIVLLGVAVAISPTWATLPVGLLCVGAQLLICVLLSRAASTSLADLMATRRGRDLGMLVGFAVFVIYLGVNAALGQVGESSGLGAGLSVTATVLGWTPPGALARIPGLVATGEWAAVALLAGIVLATIGVGYWWWSKALIRSLESGVSVTESSAPAGDHRFGDAADGTVRVVAFRDAVLVWRDPMRRLPWLMIVVLMVGMPFIWVRGHGALFTVSFGALLAGTQVGNQFGVDGSGMWLHIVALGDRTRARAEIVGHLLLVLLPGAVLVVISVVVLGLLKDDVPFLPAALGGGLGCLLGGAALACYLSAVKPYAMPQARGSLFASAAPQHKARAFQVSMGVLFGGLAVGLPGLAFIPLAVFVASWWGWIGLLVGPVAAGAVTWLLVNAASRIYFETAPEIFAEVRAGDRV